MKNECSEVMWPARKNVKLAQKRPTVILKFNPYLHIQIYPQNQICFIFGSSIPLTGMTPLMFLQERGLTKGQ